MLRKKTHILYYAIILILINFGGSSCTKDIYPSGLEGNLTGYDGNFEQEQRKRKRIARRESRRTGRLERKANRPSVRSNRKSDRASNRLRKKHINNQAPHVRARMKKNLRETRRYYWSKQTLKEKLIFWNKNNCSNGF